MKPWGMFLLWVSLFNMMSAFMPEEGQSVWWRFANLGASLICLLLAGLERRRS